MAYDPIATLNKSHAAAATARSNLARSIGVSGGIAALGILASMAGRASAQQPQVVHVPVPVKPNVLEFLLDVDPALLVWFTVFVNLSGFADDAAKAHNVDLLNAPTDWKTWANTEADKRMVTDLHNLFEKMMPDSKLSESLERMELIFRGLKDWYAKRGR